MATSELLKEIVECYTANLGPASTQWQKDCHVGYIDTIHVPMLYTARRLLNGEPC